MEKDEWVHTYFDHAGSRCFVFCHELGKQTLCTKHHPLRRVNHLDIDVLAMKRLGADYLRARSRLAITKAWG